MSTGYLKIAQCVINLLRVPTLKILSDYMRRIVTNDINSYLGISNWHVPGTDDKFSIGARE